MNYEFNERIQRNFEEIKLFIINTRLKVNKDKRMQITPLSSYGHYKFRANLNASISTTISGRGSTTSMCLTRPSG